eukprot:3210773-Rhodomonas_salina.2
MEVKAEDLVPILLRRPELATVLKPAERISLTPEEQLHRLWTDPSMSDEATSFPSSLLFALLCSGLT